MGVGIALIAGTAITLGSIATTAVVVGTALSIAGAVTKNKTLSYIGLGLGLAGGVASIAAAAGLFSSATTVSSLFGGASSAASGATTAATTAVGAGGTVGQVAAPVTSSVIPTINPVVSAGLQTGIGAATAPAATGVNAAFAAAAPALTGAQAVAPAAGLIGSGGAGQLFSQFAPKAAAAFTAPEAPQPQQVQTPEQINLRNQFAQGSGQTLATGPAQGQTLGQWFASLSPAMQGSLAIMGGQGVSGLLGGMFASRQASEQLDLERLIQNQRNQLGLKQVAVQEGGLDLEKSKFERATSTPGIISFGGHA